MRTHILTLAAILTLGAAHAATAAPDPAMADMKGMAMPASATKTGKGVGVITEIDAKAGALTIKHGPIPSLGWPAMTMGFHVKSPAMLKGLKVGQKIGFDANQGSGLPEITAIRTPSRST
ncbi:copper-binding protein [Phenylobacterium sp.]|uniref:copper-binding protein n=1 Tax=Phenylobacterium sp. TaxID=1871053 RepID=UPI00356406E6